MSQASSAASPWLASLSDATLQKLTSAAVFARGQTYAASGAIEMQPDAALKKGEQAARQAVVHGTHPYAVRVSIGTNGKLRGSCDCPHAEEGNFCKHLVATALVWRGELGGDAPAFDEQAARKVASAAKRARTQAEQRDALRRFVTEQSAEALAGRLWAWAERDRDCMADLKAWASISQAADDPKTLRTVLSDLLRDRREYLDRNQSTHYAQRAGAALNLLRPWLARDAAVALDLCEHTLRGLYKVAENADDSDGDLGSLIVQVMALLLGALRAAPAPAAWLDRWFSLMQADPWGMWDEKAVLDAAGPAVQARYAERARMDWEAWQRSHPPKTGAEKARAEKTGPGRYIASFHDLEIDLERERLRRRYLDSIALQGDPRALLDAMAASADTARDYGEIITLCETHDWYREALQWAQVAVKRYPQDHNCENALLRCYQRDGWDEEVLAIYRKRLTTFPYDMAVYKATLDAAVRAGHERAAYRAELLAWAEQREQDELQAERKRATARYPDGKVTANVSLRVQWLLAGGGAKDVQAALALVQPAENRCSASTLEALARKLTKSNPTEAGQLLMRVFNDCMPNASSPYTQPLALVRDIVALLPPDQSAVWLSQLRATYKTKRNFIAGLPG